ncbi:hypothetical protein FZX02_01415 [Synechococcus sp. MU1644]|nr:hypothetical protein [Synechococcus sp. MU1644]
MASNLRIINWQADKMTSTLNTKALAPLAHSQAKYNYIPNSLTVRREPASEPAPGVWGRHNTLVVQSEGSSGSQLYNDLTDPADAAPNIEMLLWIFPDYVVFSQLEKQLGQKIYPS